MFRQRDQLASKEVIWVCGLSDVGKETFINAVMDQSLLRSKLGIGCIPMPFGAGFTPSGRYVKIEAAPDIAIVKWQFRTHHWIQDLLARAAEANIVASSSGDLGRSTLRILRTGKKRRVMIPLVS